MLKVLVNAYAVCPGRGSEEGVGWNWCSNLARHCELYIITESEFREQIKAALKEDEQLRQRMHFYFVDAGETEEKTQRIRKMCWNQGTWRFYWFYQQWQKKAVEKAREIIDQQEFMGQPIQVMHQLNMVGFREPGMLYLINQDRERKKLPRIPLVWGPSGGYGSIPHSFRWRAGFHEFLKLTIKDYLNSLQLKYHHRVKEMAMGSDALIAATPSMRSGLSFYYRRKVSLNSEVGCYGNGNDNDNNELCSYDNDNENEGKKVSLKGDLEGRGGPLRLLWVGRFIYTKQLELALMVMRCCKNMPGLELHIVGEGFTPDITEKMHRKAKELEVDGMCHWHGKIPNEEVQRMMRQCDLLFFTSIFEATSTVVLEAVANRLPILCFDTCGFGVVVDDSIGYKVALTNMEQSVVDFSTAIGRIDRHREWLSRWSEGCVEKQKKYDWQTKVGRVVRTYERLVAHGGSNDRQPVHTTRLERAVDSLCDIFINWYIARK